MQRQRQFREIGEGGWADCTEEWYNYCNKSALHDTRTISGSDIKPNNYQDSNREGQSAWLGKE